MIDGAAAPATGLEPLTEAEAGLWYAQQRDPENPVFNTGQYLDLRGSLDRAVWTAAVDQAMEEARALAVRFVETADGPRRVGDAALRTRLALVDCSESADPLAEAIAAIDRDMRTPVDLARDPVAVQKLFVLAADRHLWYQRVHHVAIDGYGTGLLTRRICDLYRAAVSGTAPATRPFADPAPLDEEDAAYRAGPARAADRDYWLALFADGPEVGILADGVAVTAHSYRTAAVDLPEAASPALAAAAEAAGVSWADVVTALIGAYVQRHTGGREAIVGVPAMLRVGTAAARVPAMVMNVMPARIDAGDDRPLADLYRAVAAQLRESRRHGRYRGEQLRRDLGLLGEQRRLHGPLINILPFDAPIDLPGLSTALHVVGTGPVDDLTVTVRADASGRGLRLELDANPTLYPEDALARHAARLATFLDRAIHTTRLADVPTATDAERDFEVVEANRTDHPVEATTLVGLIEQTIARQPGAEAVAEEGRTITYAELDRETQRWAQVLATQGIGRGDFVAVCIPRSIALEVALVAIQRAGAAYLPIDPDYPDERVQRIVAIARPKAMMAVASTDRAWPAGLLRLRLDEAAAPVGDVGPEPPRPEDPAYVIFTSGSTGEPKGVVIQHAAIVNRLLWMREHYGFDESDRILQKTPATFDVSVWEFFLPLITGGVLVMAPPEAHRDPAWLARLIRQYAITTLHFVPSMLAQFVADPAAHGLAIKRVFCSGEALPTALRDRTHQVLDCELHNLYGPTEAAVDVTWWDASRHDRGPTVPIGFPVWNTRLYVLDAKRRVVPPGVAGDLYIAGVQLAREYTGRPDLTAERFVPDPFYPGERMYLTGDVARRRSDGAIEYLGRSDSQVKLRGVRIELGEIEAVIRRHETIADAAVIVREDRPGDQRLVAYVVARAGKTVVPEDISRLVQRTLPSAMVPGAIVVLDEFPLGATGKLDRRRLPIPAAGQASGGRASSSPTESALAAMFADVLGLSTPPSAVDDFFGLGGHSLLAVQLTRRINDRWACALHLGAVFAHPTIETLAAHVDDAVARGGGRVADGTEAVITLATGEAGLAPLFCVHPAGGLAWCYRGLARTLSPPRLVYGLQARALDPSAPLPDSLGALAGDYVAEVRRVQPEGPYHLLGWSVGGIIAHAMAEVFERSGARVDMLAMLDAYPCDRWRDAPPPDEGAALRALLLMGGIDPATSATPLTRDAVIATLQASGHPLGALAPDTIAGIVRVVEHNSELVRRHRHHPVACTLTHFRAALDHRDTDLSPLEWRPYVDDVQVHEIEALHAHMTGSHASRAIARVLETRMKR